jgi:hypothetical protein
VTPILPVHVIEAVYDEVDRKRELDVSGTVTQAEAHAAKIRRLAIEMENVHAAYPAVVPAWAGPLLANVIALQANVTNLLPLPHMITNERITRANKLLAAAPPVVGAGAPVFGIRVKEVCNSLCLLIQVRCSL